MSLLKADLHLHTREAESFIDHDVCALIDRAASEGYQVLSITNHDVRTFDERLAAYAARCGIVLIPGAEATIEGRHVLLYNFDVPLSVLRTFADLRKYKTPDWLVAAPHPFFPGSVSLGGRLVSEIDVFDAIELSHYYTRGIDFNRRAVTLAREVGLPLVGNSDTHLARQFGTTYSIIEAEPTTDCVLSAIRKGRVEAASQPLPLRCFVSVGVELVLRTACSRARTALGLVTSPPEPVRGLSRVR